MTSTLSIAKNDPKSELLKYGKFYLDQGFSIIPVDSRNKGGSLIERWKPYQSKRATEKELIYWINKWPQMGIAIVTGKISGITALDKDPRNGGDKTIKDKELPATVTVKTGGGGEHYYFKRPAELKHIKSFESGGKADLPGLDLKGDGGFVYAPPSIHESGNRYEFYELMGPGEVELADPPEWLLEVIRKNQAGDNGQAGGLSQDDWETTLTKGERNTELTRRAGSLLNIMSPDEVLTTLQGWNKRHCKPPLPESEVTKVVKSIAKREAEKEEEGGGDSVYKFFNKKTFIPKRLADEIMKNNNFRFHYSDWWVYDGGVYKPEGEQIIEEESQAFLGEHVRDNRVKEVKSYIRRASYSNPAQPSYELINLKNGRLNWRTGELLPHNPNNFEITQLPIEYDPEAKCPQLHQYLESTFFDEKEQKILTDIIQLVQEVCGYCLIPDTTFEKAVMLVGSGANGKSVFLYILGELLGDENVANSDLQEIADNRFRGAELLGKLANISADIGSHMLESTSRFKKMVTGDRVEVERKHKDPFRFENYARFLFSANEIPQSRDRTFAYYRRWIIIPFMRVFEGKKADKKLKYKLRKELPGIFNFALEGLRRLKENNEFTQPDQVRIEMAKYKRTNDSVAAFVAECCEADKNSMVVKQKFYNSYVDWCESQGLKAVSQRKLATALPRNVEGLDEVRPNRGTEPWNWVGIRLK